MDVVVTVPGHLWNEWLAEGDLAGQEYTGEYEYSFTVPRRPLYLKPGERVYVVAHGRLRGYAPLVRIDPGPGPSAKLVRRGGAVALTIVDHVQGFRGYRYRWWDRADERPFPDWRTHGCG